jgi:hypothetical protein
MMVCLKPLIDLYHYRNKKVDAPPTVFRHCLSHAGTSLAMLHEGGVDVFRR